MNWLSPGRTARRLPLSSALLSGVALALSLFALSCSHNTVEGDCSLQSCNFGQRCIAGRCVEESCSGPMDCVSPLSCVEGRCVMNGSAGGAGGAGGGGGMCAGPADCPGQRCENGLCVSDDCIEGNVRNCEGPCGSGVQSCIGGVWRRRGAQWSERRKSHRRGPDNRCIGGIGIALRNFVIVVVFYGAFA